MLLPTTSPSPSFLQLINSRTKRKSLITHQIIRPFQIGTEPLSPKKRQLLGYNVFKNFTGIAKGKLESNVLTIHSAFPLDTTLPTIPVYGVRFGTLKFLLLFKSVIFCFYFNILLLSCSCLPRDDFLVLLKLQQCAYLDQCPNP